jgi:hypothetical protein
MGAEYGGTLRPLMLLSPILAELFAAHGWTKQDIKQKLWEQARVPAYHMERVSRDWTQKPAWPGARSAGRMPLVYHETDSRTAWCPSLSGRLHASGHQTCRNSGYIRPQRVGLSHGPGNCRRRTGRNCAAQTAGKLKPHRRQP